MKQKTGMLSVSEALAILLATERPLTQGVEWLPTLLSNNRILANAQIAQRDVPSVDNAQMDGYAVRVADCIGGQTKLLVSQRIPAGYLGTPLEAGTAARIFTGAPIPEGADAVVMQENCVAQAEQVIVKHIPSVGEWIRRRGEDICQGQIILPAGTRLQAQHLGLAASVGLEKLPVRSRLRVAMFFTGDELVMPGQPLPAGGVYNSNRFILRGLLENLNCDISDYGIIPDDKQATREALRLAAQEHDLILTSGGVSVGEEDHVKSAVEAEGQLTLWQIAMKPGKPFAFGKVRRNEHESAFFIGLPGNPVSSFVTFLILVRPFVLSLQGVTKVMPQALLMRADFDYAKPDSRQEFLRAKINQHGGLDLFPHQGSAVLTSVVWGDGLIDKAVGETIKQGDMLRFLPFSSLLS